jgi:hypothetical protein
MALDEVVRRPELPILGIVWISQQILDNCQQGLQNHKMIDRQAFGRAER